MISITIPTKGITNILLIEPLDYSQFVRAMKYCKIILSDSGGVQEEGPFIGKPVVVLKKIPNDLKQSKMRLHF